MPCPIFAALRRLRTHSGSGSEERLDDGTLGRTISSGYPSAEVPIESGRSTGGVALFCAEGISSDGNRAGGQPADYEAGRSQPHAFQAMMASASAIRPK